jgi:hypothetical protein
MVMIGGSFPREELTGYIDIYDPQIGGGSKVYSLQEQNAAAAAAQSRQRGEEFYWYVAAGPEYPHPNVQVEYPLSDSRALFWMTWKYRVTGFEYYCYNIWHHNFAPDPAQRYPRVKWNADGWEQGWPSNGDGMLYYPGPISSLRFEALRDGIEDWEMLQVLSDCVEAVRRRKHQDKYQALLEEARNLLEVNPEVVKGFTDFTRDPQRLLAERDKVGDLIAKFIPLVNALEKWDTGQMTLAKAAEVRIANQATRRRRMLRERHIQACEALKVPPLSDEEWENLWPKRVLFRENFEQGAKEEGGEIVTDNVPPGAKQALAGHTKNKYYGRFAQVAIYFDNARAAATTYLNFKYFINKDTPIGIMAFDMNQSDNFVGSLAKPEVGKWAEATLKVTDFRKKDGARKKIAGGDAIDDIFFSAGKPGDADLQLLVADVVLLGVD